MATTQSVLEHHMKAFGEGDIDGLLADFADDCVIMSPQGTLKGKEAIRPLFEGFIAEFGKEGVTFEMDYQEVQGNIAFIVWHGDTPDNTYEVAVDTFVIRDDKIQTQTFAGKITPK